MYAAAISIRDFVACKRGIDQQLQDDLHRWDIIETALTRIFDLCFFLFAQFAWLEAGLGELYQTICMC